MRPGGASLDENVQNLRDRYLQSTQLPMLLFELPVDLKLSLQLNLQSRRIARLPQSYMLIPQSRLP